MLKNSSEKLTDAQLALLQLFNVELNESDMLELKSLLVNFLNTKLQREIDDVFEQKNTHKINLSNG